MSELASHFGQAPAPIWSKLQSLKSHESYPVGTTLARERTKQTPYSIWGRAALNQIGTWWWYTSKF